MKNKSIVIVLLLLSTHNLFSQNIDIKEIKMKETKYNYGIEGKAAPSLQVKKWVDGNGQEIPPINLEDYKGKFKVIYCFQSWCPGCHSIGLPSLQKMVAELNNNNNVAFFAIQTVFEGSHANTHEAMLEVQQKYELKIPFGHDTGSPSTRNISSIMHDYKTGGTPWFIFIDENDRVIFNDFHLNTEKAIEYLSQTVAK